MNETAQGAEHAMTLRIRADHHAALVWIAKLRGTSVAAEVREAIGNYIEARRRDPDFQTRLRSHRAEQEAVYERLTVRGELEEKRHV